MLTEKDKGKSKIEKPTVQFHFDKKDKSAPDMSSLKVGKSASVVIKGKVTSVSDDEWGKSFGVKIEEVEIVTQNEQQKIINDMLDKL